MLQSDNKLSSVGNILTQKIHSGRNSILEIYILETFLLKSTNDIPITMLFFPFLFRVTKRTLSCNKVVILLVMLDDVILFVT